MSKSEAPAAPNPVTTAQAQTASNQATAQNQTELNDQNQVTPYGSLTYAQNGTYPDGTPQYTATTQLSQPEQNLLNIGQTGAQSLGGSALNLLGQVNQNTAPINYSGLPGIASSASSNIPLATSVGNVSGDPAIQQAENAAYSQQAQYLNPQFSQAQEALSNNLINQGITQGSQAANTAQQNLGLQENQAYGNAADQAVAAGQAEQNTLYGQGLQSANLQNTAQQQQFGQGLNNAQLQNQAQAQGLQQLYAQQAQPTNEYNALMTGAQVQQPNFINTTQTSVNPTNVAGITQSSYQDALQNYQQQMAGVNNLFSLGGSLGSAAILA